MSRLFDEPLHEVVRSVVALDRLERLASCDGILYDFDTPCHFRLKHVCNLSSPVPSWQTQYRHNHWLKWPRNERSEDKTREPKAYPPLLNCFKVLLTPANRKSNDDSVCHAANRLANSIVDRDVLPAIRCILALGKVRVKSMPNFIQDFRYASIDLPRQISPDDGKVVDESVARPRSEPLKPQNLVLHFGICDDMLRLAGEPFGITGRQND